MSTVPSEVNDPSPSRRNWLAALLLRSPDRWFGRFRLQLLHLSALGRNYRRRLSRKTALTVTGAALMMTLGGAALAGPLLGTDTITVTPGSAGINNGDGCSLVEAIENANSNTNNHTECGTGSGDDTIELGGNTYVYYGPFGPNSALPDITGNLTIDGHGSIVQGDTSYAAFRLLFVAGGGNLTLNETTITGGSSGSGGGILVYTGSSLTLNDSSVSGNDAEIGGGMAIYGTLNATRSMINDNVADHGAGIYARYATVSLYDSSMSGNAANIDTGAILANKSDISILKSGFVYNSSQSYNSGGLTAMDAGHVIVGYSYFYYNSGIDGGAMKVTGTDDMKVYNSRIVGNEAESGGGIFIGNNTTATIQSTTIAGNAADFGGGIASEFSHLALIDSTIGQNTAVNNGGGLTVLDTILEVGRTTIQENEAHNGGGLAARGTITPSQVTIDSSTFRVNIAELYGGAIDLDQASEAAVVNTTITGNSAAKGGGISATTASVLNMKASTVTGNSAEQFGGGLYLNSEATVSLFGSIVSGNSATLGFEMGLGMANVLAISGNVLGHGGINSGQAFYNVNPSADNFRATSDSNNIALAAIIETTAADNGGPTLTHALVPNSPALDFLASADCMAAPINGIDQRGEPRNLDGDSQASNEECDAGAFELAIEQPTATPSPTATATATPTATGTAQPPGDERNFLPFTTR